MFCNDARTSEHWKLQMERKIYNTETYMDSMYGKPDSLRAATIPTLMQIGYIKRYNVTHHACRQPLSPIDIVSVRLSRHLHDCGAPHHRIHSLLAPRYRNIKCVACHFQGRLCKTTDNLCDSRSEHRQPMERDVCQWIISNWQKRQKRFPCYLIYDRHCDSNDGIVHLWVKWELPYRNDRYGKIAICW